MLVPSENKHEKCKIYTLSQNNSNLYVCDEYKRRAIQTYKHAYYVYIYMC